MNLYHNKNKKYKNKKEFAAMVFHGATFYALVILLVAGMLFSLSVYSAERNVSMEASGLENVGRGDSIEIVFSSRMLKQSVENGIHIEPDLKIGTRWDGDKKLEIVPIETPCPGTAYLIRIKGAKTSWFVSQGDFEIEFTSSEFPNLTRAYPVDGQENVDYYEHITMELDRPLAADFKLEVSINPLTGFTHSLNEARTQLVIKPDEKLEKNTRYSVSAKVWHQEYKNETKELFEGEFVTKPPSVVVYNFDANGNPAKTEQRQEEIIPQILQGKSIEIDLSSQSLFIFEDGKERGAFKISTGLRGMDTPAGTHQVLAKSRRPWSAKYKLYMPWFVQFTNAGHGIHELPEWPGGYKEGANHLGIPVSHGCVRLGIGPAKTVYDFAETGTPVIIHQ